MRVSRKQMSANRARILDAASRLFRERGFEGVTVSEVMQAAGMTHGGFYGHFPSKDALIAETIAHALSGDGAGRRDLVQWIDAYLSPRHRDSPAAGCPAAGLAGRMPQQAPEARAAMADGLACHLDRMARAFSGATPEEQRRTAIGTWSAMVGALVLARAVGDSPLADELLRETRAWIDERAPQPTSETEGKPL